MKDKIIKTLKKVVKDWDIGEIIVATLFFPFTLVYILIRFIQEY